MKRCLFSIMIMVVSTMLSCFPATVEQRRYYVLHMNPPAVAATPLASGLLRVRDLDVDAAYDKAQLVVRQSQYELSYRESDVWAVKPNRMISDALANYFAESKLFDSVTRELAERRPDFSISGTIHAIEINQRGTSWNVRLSTTYTISRSENGNTLANFQFDQSIPTEHNHFTSAMKALSLLVQQSAEQFGAFLRDVPLSTGAVRSK